MNYYNEIKNRLIDNKVYSRVKDYSKERDTIGILVCKRENKFVIEYCSDERIVVREYELV